jgi:hypothetical protein
MDGLQLQYSVTIIYTRINSFSVTAVVLIYYYYHSREAVKSAR